MRQHTNTLIKRRKYECIKDIPYGDSYLRNIDDFIKYEDNVLKDDIIDKICSFENKKIEDMEYAYWKAMTESSLTKQQQISSYTKLFEKMMDSYEKWSIQNLFASSSIWEWSKGGYYDGVPREDPSLEDWSTFNDPFGVIDHFISTIRERDGNIITKRMGKAIMGKTGVHECKAKLHLECKKIN